MPKGTVRDYDDEGQGPSQNASGIGYLEITEYPANTDLVGNWKAYKKVGTGATAVNGNTVVFTLGAKENPGNGQGNGAVQMRFATIESIDP